MISDIRAFLESRLRAAGLTAQIFTNYRDLEASRAVTLGAVLFEKEKFVPDSTKVRHMNGTTPQVRERVYTRIVIMSVVIGGVTESEVETISTKFTGLLGRGLPDNNGNYIALKLLEGDWVMEKESILASKVAVQYGIEFTGGVYKTDDLVKLTPGDIITTPNGGV